MCKYIQPNLTQKQLCYLWYNKTSKGWKLWAQPWLSWWDPRAMPLALPVLLSWICLLSWASLSFQSFLPSGLGSCLCVSSRYCGKAEGFAPSFALLGLLSGGVNNGELKKQKGCLNPSKNGTAALTPCSPELLWELIAIPAVAASFWIVSWLVPVLTASALSSLCLSHLPNDHMNKGLSPGLGSTVKNCLDPSN